MERVVFLDPQALANLDTDWMAPADTAIKAAVEEAREKLPGALDLLIYQWVYEGLTIAEMARINGLSTRQVRAGLYEAGRLLKIYLAEFAFNRWGIKAANCRICAHPQVAEIDRLLDSKDDSETWGAFNLRLEKAIGERINPPSVLIAHIRHRANRKAAGGGCHEGR